MTETIIRFAIFIFIILLFAFVLQLGNKFPVIGAILSFLRKTIIILFMLFWCGLIIFVHSFLAYIVIGLAAFIGSDIYYFYAGEPVNPLLDDHRAVLLKLSMTYGILYFIVYVGIIFFYSRFQLNKWIMNGLIFVTTSIVIVFLYPIIVQALFLNIVVTFKGALFLVVHIFLLVLKRSLQWRDDHEERHYDSSILYRLTSWLNSKAVR